MMKAQAGCEIGIKGTSLQISFVSTKKYQNRKINSSWLAPASQSFREMSKSQKISSPYLEQWTLGVQVRNMKMDFNTGGTLLWVIQWTLRMKINDFFIWLSRLFALYNSMLKIFHLCIDFFILLYNTTKRLIEE